MIGDIMQVKIACTFLQQVGLNIRHYRVTDEVTPVPGLDLVAASFSQVFNLLYKDLLTSVGEFYGVGVQKILPPPTGVEAANTANSGPGTVAGDALPSQICGLITLRTAEGGRSGRGRVYIPFPPEDRNAIGGVPTALYLGVLGLLATEFTDALVVTQGGGSITLEPGVLSRLGGGVFSRIVSADARERWATQRRRGLFGAANALPF